MERAQQKSMSTAKLFPINTPAEVILDALHAAGRSNVTAAEDCADEDAANAANAANAATAANASNASEMNARLELATARRRIGALKKENYALRIDRANGMVELSDAYNKLREQETHFAAIEEELRTLKGVLHTIEGAIQKGKAVA
mgnify:CR=1 FL=1|tara:strand:- start:163 stop:597 length:435 start_codon:yes stop_codon:yes gene_type:complete